MALTAVTGTENITTIQKPNTGIPSLCFPRDLGTPPFNYWMSLSFYKYQRPTVTNIIDIIKGIQNTGILDDNGTIRLPIPNSLVDHQDEEYSSENYGIVAGAAANLLAAAGQTANPFLAIMYRSPAFKTHNFMWRLSPSNKIESQTLNKIINTLKYNELPTFELSGFTLGYPNIVQVTLSCLTSDYFSFTYKPAVIRSFEVNYTPEGQPSFFGGSATGDAAPTVVEIRMTITEIEYWTQSDFGLNTNTGASINFNPNPTIPGSTAIPGTPYGTGS